VDVARAVVRAGGSAVVASAGGPMVRELERAGARHVVLPVDSKNPLTMRRNVDALLRLIGEFNVDLVHARSRAPAWSARAAARRAGKPFVTTFHGTYNAGNFLKRRYNAIMQSGDLAIAISDFIAAHMRERYRTPASRIRVIHRGVDLAAFDPQAVPAPRVVQLAEEWRLPDGVPIALLPGRLTRWKGQGVFLHALERLKDLDMLGLIVGSEQGRVAYRAELDGLVEKLGLQRHVRILDQCRDMPAAFMLSDVVISASTDPEGFGRVMAEAQAMGRPVIAADHGAAAEIVVPGETGWLVPPGDAEALAAAIRAALGLSPDARAAMAAAAGARARARFGKDRMCEATLAVYREAIAMRAGAA
jgi:glycosyltransferase involved in cell wall biosynthesis